MQKYVVGFIFNKDLDTVLLMHKNSPAWQNGLVNGLGGKVDGEETSFDCIVREIKEESGLITLEDRWIKTGKVYSNTFTMDVFGYIYDGDMNNAKTLEDEQIEWFPINKLPKNCVENVTWLVNITLDKVRNNNFESFEVRYKK